LDSAKPHPYYRIMTSSEWDALALLAEPHRREVYQFVIDAPAPVTRDKVADALGLSRSAASFHLDKMAEAGLLDATFAYPAGRQPGPGAGRPSKFYGRSETEVEISLPSRRYDLAGAILAQALDSEAEDPRRAAGEIAHAEGRSVGVQYRQRLQPSGRRAQQLCEHALTDVGFAPLVKGPDIELRNCPFHRLAKASPDLICGLNLAFINGVIEGLGGHGRLAADLVGQEGGGCCVAVRRRVGA
jgi:predicted ArsR family transcriptional regulator